MVPSMTQMSIAKANSGHSKIKQGSHSATSSVRVAVLKSLGHPGAAVTGEFWLGTQHTHDLQRPTLHGLAGWSAVFRRTCVGGHQRSLLGPLCVEVGFQWATVCQAG